MDEQEKRIHRVLKGIDEDDEVATLDAWEKFLKENLTFPFKAKVSKYQERGKMKTGDVLTVTGISDVDDLYGVIITANFKKKNPLSPV